MLSWPGKKKPEKPAPDSPQISEKARDISRRRWPADRVDVGQFEAFYRQYYDRIFHYVRLGVSDWDQAQDLTNEVFSRALDKLDSFRWQGYSFGAWLYRIARNVVLEEVRRRKTMPEMGEMVEFAGPDRTDHDLLRSEEDQLLHECVQQLDETRREVFRSFYWADLSVKEIAVITGLSESNVKNHLSRGRAQLRKWLLDRGIEAGLSPETATVVRESLAREEGWNLLDGEGGESS